MNRLAKTLAATAVGVGLVTAPATTASAALAAKVRVVDSDFRPESVTVAAGSTVGWINRGFIQHTVSFDADGDGVYEYDAVLEAGEKARRRFRTPGTYAYTCRFHFGMDGEVVVTG